MNKCIHLLFLMFIAPTYISYPMFNPVINWENTLPDRLITIGLETAIAAPIIATCLTFFVRFCPAKFQNWYDRHELGMKAFSFLARASCLPSVLGGVLMLRSQAPLESKVLGAGALASGLGIMYADFCLNSLWKFPNTKTHHVLKSLLKNNGASYIGGGLVCCGIALI